MKKLLFLFVLGMSLSVVHAQRSRIRTGDRTLKQLSKAQGMVYCRINDINQQIDKINTKDNKLRKRVKDQPSLNDVLRGDSLSLISLKSKKASLEASLDGMLLEMMLMLKQRSVDLRGKPQEVAMAYYLLSSSNNDRANKAIKLDSAIVINNWYKGIMLEVRGPGGYFYSTWLKKKSRIIFNVPMIGTYMVSFIRGDARSSVSKRVSPLTHYRYEGRNYSFVSVLPSN